MKSPISLFMLFLLLILSGCASAYLKAGDKYFNNLEYSNAIPHYEKYIEKGTRNNDVLLSLANCYRNTDQISKWESALKSIVKKEDVDPSYYFQYAEALMGNDKYDDAIIWLTKYSDLVPSNELAKNKLNFLLSQSNETTIPFYTVELLDLKMKGSSFAPQFYKKGIVFCAESPWKGTATESYGWTGRGYLDIYYTEFDKDNKPRNLQPFNDLINTEIHEGPIAFAASNSTVYYTANNYETKEVKRKADGINNLQLYKTTLEGNKMKDTEEFFFNHKSYSTGHATISDDGNKIIFISDAPWGKGGTDLYVCNLSEKGELEAFNLEGLNTKGNEMFPVFYKDKAAGKEYVYFASDGIAGYGGLDVFFAEIKADNSIGEIKHLPPPINSSRDDFSLILDTDGISGFFASNRDNEDGIDKLYRLTKITAFIDVLVEDKETKERLDKVKIEFNESNIETGSTNENGQYVFNSQLGVEHFVSLSKQYYQTMDFTIKVENNPSIDTIDVTLKLQRKMIHLVGD